jgi:hypothetical protein
MTLLDAPAFDEARAKRNRIIAWSSTAAIVLLFILWWLLAGRPIDWPWNWNNHLFGRMAVNHFMDDLEKGDLKAAYGVWIHDPNWQQHPNQRGAYPFTRFDADWNPSSPDAEYHQYRSHHIAASRMYGNVLLVAILMNGAKQNALDLTWDPRTRQLSFAPPGVRLSTVPWAVVP